MPNQFHFVIAGSNSFGHRVTNLVTTWYADKSSICQRDIALLPGHIDVLTIDAAILLAVVIGHFGWFTSGVQRVSG